MSVVSNVNGIGVVACGSRSGCGVVEGEGHRTTEGMRVCDDLAEGCVIVLSVDLLLSTSIGALPSLSLADSGNFAFSDQSHSKPGLSIKLITSPSFTLYSLSNFPSARAFPFSKSL